jgi:hypothetical protein
LLLALWSAILVQRLLLPWLVSGVGGGVRVCAVVAGVVAVAGSWSPDWWPGVNSSRRIHGINSNLFVASF